MARPTAFLSVFFITSTFITVAHAQGPGFAPATKAKDGPQGCKAPAFLDARLDDWSAGPQCWSCPSGYERTADPVTARTACFKDGGTTYKEATFEHKFLCDGEKREFFDPRKGGECWRCPKDRPRRTLNAVTGKKACATEALIGEKLSKATFVRKARTCPGKSFYDPRRGGECWSCPSGHTRTLEAVTTKKACARETSDSHVAAKLENQLGCPKGHFFDPRNGGECWKCPSSHPYRTVSAVTADKACSDNPIGILAAEAGGACKDMIRTIARALDEGAKAQKTLEGAIQPVIAPVSALLQEQMSKMTDLAGDFDALEPIISKFETSWLDRVAAFGESFGGASADLRALLLDESICTLGPRELEARIKAHIRPPPGMDGFVAVSVGASFTYSLYKTTAQIALTLITDLGGQGGIFVSGKLGASTSAEPFAVGLSAMLFPGARLEDFGLSPAPGVTVSVSKGAGFDDLFEKLPTIKKLTKVIDGVDIGWAPAAPTKMPTFGVAKSLYSKGGNVQSLVDFTATAGWDFPIVRWSGYALR